MSTKKQNTTRAPKQSAEAIPTIAQRGKHALPRHLTTTQAVFLDYAGDLIVNGGHPEDLQALVRAVMKHVSMKQSWVHDVQFERFGLDKGPAKTREDASEYAEKFHTKRELELMALWPKTPTRLDDPPVTTATEMARQAIREQLRIRFEDFLYSGTAEEHRFLCHVFDFWETSNIGPFERETRCPLIENFMMELEQSDTFVRVPEKHAQRVRDFIALLEPKAA